MARYFQILRGLRGCYMPDSSYIIACDTRRELRAAIEGESAMGAESEYGWSRAVISWAAAKAWREYPTHKSVYALALIPFGYEKKARPFALEICQSNRAEYLAHNS